MFNVHDANKKKGNANVSGIDTKRTQKSSEVIIIKFYFCISLSRSANTLCGSGQCFFILLF